jgi:drug/metabolite transporter (DMT)-like permease
MKKPAFRRDSLLGSAYLALAALIWGCAFVAQSVGNEYVGPFTFQTTRSILGAATLAPIIWIRRRRARKRCTWRPLSPQSRRTLWLGGIACGVLLAVAINLQQVALLGASAGKAGFLTALYILFVPIFGAFVGKRPPPLLWFCVLMAAVGLYLLSVKEGFSIARADLLLILCAIVFTGHILVVDAVSPMVSGIQLSCLQFLVAGVLSAIPMLIFEQPSLSAILKGWLPITYTGVLSSGVAYTLQILGQRRTSPTMASLLMSLESVFAALAGLMILGERMAPRELLGCAIMFGAILLAQLAQVPRGAVTVKTSQNPESL